MNENLKDLNSRKETPMAKDHNQKQGGINEH